MRTLRIRNLAAACAAIASVAALGASNALAQAVDLKNTTARMVNVEAMDASGSTFGPKVAGALAVTGGMATITIAAANASPGAPTFAPLNLMGDSIMVNFTNGRFNTVADRKISIEVATGETRVEQTTMGMIDLMIAAFGLNLNQPIMFNTATVSATNLGPLFSGDELPVMGQNVTGGGMLRIPGMGRACAMMGSAFLDSMIGVPQCTPQTFGNTKQLDPKKFDAATGQVTTVGFNAITLPPFTVAGAIMINVAPIRNATPLTLRITELGR